METERVRERLWRKLSNNQRLHLMNEASPRDQRAHQSYFIAASRVLERLGLENYPGRLDRLTPEGRGLADWAREHGYAQWTGGGWTFTEAEHNSRRIDPERLAQLAGEGMHGAAIARQLGVSHQAVRSAAARHGVTLPRRPKKPTPPPRVHIPRTKPLTVKVSEDELANIKQAAKRQGVKVSDWVRQAIEGVIQLEDIGFADYVPPGQCRS